MKFHSRVAGVVIAWVLWTAVAAAQPEGSTRDTLVYKDGDRVQGRLLRREGDVLVFKADRFGELRVPASDAVVVNAEKPAESVATVAAPAGLATARENEKAAERTEEERISLWERFSPWMLTAKVRNYFGPWHGRFAFATEAVTDTAQRSTIAVEGHMKRKWKRDEVQLNSRYDFSETNHVTTTDVMRADALWRHDFTQGRFSQYRPTVEWNRANVKNGVPSDYVLLQQEIGGGYTVLDQPIRKVRLGASENLFDTWTMGPASSRTSRVVESVFDETELTLPWRMTLTQRAMLYNPLSSARAAWENRVEVNKKLTETLSVGVRHEVRKNNPDGSSQDYQRLQLMLGLDF